MFYCFYRFSGFTKKMFFSLGELVCAAKSALVKCFGCKPSLGNLGLLCFKLALNIATTNQKFFCNTS